MGRKRKADSDEEYDPMQDSTDNQRKQTKKKKSSSKEEADSDDESSDEILVPKRQLSRRNSSVSITNSSLRQLPKPTPKKKKDDKWKTKKFDSFNVKHSIAPKKSAHYWQ